MSQALLLWPSCSTAANCGASRLREHSDLPMRGPAGEEADRPPVVLALADEDEPHLPQHAVRGRVVREGIGPDRLTQLGSDGAELPGDLGSQTPTPDVRVEGVADPARATSSGSGSEVVLSTSCRDGRREPRPGERVPRRRVR